MRASTRVRARGKGIGRDVVAKFNLYGWLIFSETGVRQGGDGDGREGDFFDVGRKLAVGIGRMTFSGGSDLLFRSPVVTHGNVSFFLSRTKTTRRRTRGRGRRQRG